MHTGLYIMQKYKLKHVNIRSINYVVIAFAE